MPKRLVIELGIDAVSAEVSLRVLFEIGFIATTYAQHDPYRPNLTAVYLASEGKEFLAAIGEP